jgi:hypothetical protein
LYKAKPTRFAAPLVLLPALFVAQTLFYETAGLQRRSWHEDTSSPLEVTREWIPNRVYSLEIERGVSVLAQSDPEKVRFLRERGIPIHILIPEQMALSGCPTGSIGCTRHTDSSINVIAAAVSPVSLAVVLSHELTHCRLHDLASGMTVPSAWTRLFWRNEESNAHVAGLATARRLQLPQFHGPLAGWWFDYLVWFWPAATMFMSGVASLVGFHLIVEYIKRYALRKPRALSAGPEAPITFQSSATPSAIL